MSALPPEDMLAMRNADLSVRPSPGDPAKHWGQLQFQAQQLAKMAGLSPERDQIDEAAFSKLLRRAARWQRTLSYQSLEDIDAMMQPGMGALSTISERGQDTTAPALALWREYHAARSGVLEMLAPPDHPEPLDVA